MYGNGCAGSTASGVSTGKICCLKTEWSWLSSFFVTSSPRTKVMPAVASAGTMSELKMLVWR